MFSEFQPVTKEEWLRKVEKDLKGKPLESLDWSIDNDWKLSPFKHSEDITQPLWLADGRKETRWDKGVLLEISQPKATNKLALELLKNGATSLHFSIDSLPSSNDLLQIFEGIQLDWITTHFSLSSGDSSIFLKRLLAVLNEKSIDPGEVQCSVKALDIPDVQLWRENLPLSMPLTIDGLPFHKGLAHLPEELAHILLKANQLMEIIQSEGITKGTIPELFLIKMTIDDHFFPSLAKIRAMKWLWTQWLKAWDLPEQIPSIEILIHPEGAVDENYNKIRATSMAIAAVSGGATGVCILPANYGENGTTDEFNQRIALNIQHLLELESHFQWVNDPAAGSYYIESLTETIAQKAWKIFQQKA